MSNTTRDLIDMFRKLVCTYPIVCGIILILGDRRFEDSSYAVARQVPGEHYTWGGLFVLAGVLGLIGVFNESKAWLRSIFGIILLHMFFAITTFISGIEYGNASFLPTATAAFAAIVTALAYVGMMNHPHLHVQA